MKTIRKPWIKLKENIDSEDYSLIKQLEERCLQNDQTVLKLELDYKLGANHNKSGGLQGVNEFMYFDDNKLIGYIGVSRFGGPWEVNGMVDPEYRRQGVFKKLSELVLVEWKRSNSSSILLLSDRQSRSGERFIQGTGAKHKHSEFEMFLKNDMPNQQFFESDEITLRKAANADMKEIARQNAIYFGAGSSGGEEPDTNSMIPPEEEEKRGMTCYLAEKDGQIVGKVNLQMTSRIGAIFGLGVLPEHRGKGYGRAILLLAIGKLKEAVMDDIMLQVEAKNVNALNLYTSCGFEETSTMDYYVIEKE
ncbi:GNAT family N-acetyltransferase [Bacillus sp. REN3]|uniref:GNAT family N-acetyltransferase n=1 Tax=Bacillus sp. REN3 TaxID=2802440 RepID=UPI001AED77A6|nr:GNAT family N-acetyltransferase [Bacillus sp. REN3]